MNSNSLNKNQNNSSYILILGGEFLLRERALAGALRAGEGMPVYSIVKNRFTPVLKFYDGVIDADVMDPKSVLDAVKAHERETRMRPAAVIPMNDFVVRSGLAVAEAYNLPYNSSRTVEICRDKFKMKKVLSEAGLPVPKFAEFRTAEELKTIASQFRFPVVLKPSELAGSVAVMKVDTASELESVFIRCVGEVAELGGAFKTREDVYQIEEYIESNNEVSIEVLNHKDFQKVLAVTDKYLGSEPYFVEIGHSVPSYQSENEYLKTVAMKACSALGIVYGIAHVEARITPKGEVMLIEVGARTGGDTIMDLIERTYGINPYQYYVESLLDKMPTVPEVLMPRGVSAVAFLKADCGKVLSVKIPKSIPKVVTHLQITAKPLDRSLVPNSWKNREGTAEFFFENEKPSKGFRKHLDLADSLVDEIFEIETNEFQLVSKQAVSS